MPIEANNVVERLARKQILHLGPPRGRVEAGLLNPDGPDAIKLIQSLSDRIDALEGALGLAADRLLLHGHRGSADEALAVLTQGGKNNV